MRLNEVETVAVRRFALQFCSEIDASEMCTAYGEDDELELASGNNALTMVEATMESPQINHKKHNLNTGDRYAELCAVGTRKVNQVKSHPEEPVNAVTRCNTGIMLGYSIGRLVI